MGRKGNDEDVLWMQNVSSLTGTLQKKEYWGSVRPVIGHGDPLHTELVVIIDAGLGSMVAASKT